MTKPHEEEWRTAIDADETACAVYDRDGRMIADLRMRGEFWAEVERAKFITASPRTARALRRLLEAFPPAGSEAEADAVAEARAALREAGVLE
jgi:Xaa-Pro aminopeptidase